MHVPLLRPVLPTAEDLLPYLRRIDRSRIYSNWGPLAEELSGRLADIFGLPSGSVVTASSGTAALVGGMLAVAGEGDAKKKYAVTQSMTFVATLSAIEQCGFEAKLLDVDPETWSLDPTEITALPDLDQVGVVVPVAPYGRTISWKKWEEFSRTTGIPVVIDAAACFDTLLDTQFDAIGSIPIVLSFHATKFFSSSEGGCLVCTDTSLAERAASALNFGFSEDRASRSRSINGKLSEYCAALGLASIDQLSDKVSRSNEFFRVYSSLFEDVPGCELLTTPGISRTYALLQLNDVPSELIEDELRNGGIEHRLWYGLGLHRQPYVERRHGIVHCPVTDRLCARLIGMPVALDFTATEIAGLEAFAVSLKNRLNRLRYNSITAIGAGVDRPVAHNSCATPRRVSNKSQEHWRRTPSPMRLRLGRNWIDDPKQD
jgi:dTDP-4-amino-4,6-dideoxygalactose transaminase